MFLSDYTDDDFLNLSESEREELFEAERLTQAKRGYEVEAAILSNCNDPKVLHSTAQAAIERAGATRKVSEYNNPNALNISPEQLASTFKILASMFGQSSGSAPEPVREAEGEHKELRSALAKLKEGKQSEESSEPDEDSTEPTETT